MKEENFLADGDLLITRLSGSIAYVGNCSVVANLDGRRIQYPDRLFRCRLANPEESQFVELTFAGPGIRSQIEAASRSAAGHGRISIADLKGFRLPRPPLAEQHDIVKRVSVLLSLADLVHERAESAVARLDRSSQAVLAQAVRGELDIERGA